MIMIKKITTMVAFFAAPYIAIAQGTIDSTNIKTLAQGLSSLINGTLIPLLVGFAFLFTVYAIADFIANQDTQKKEEKKQRIFWGIIGLTVILSIWGLVSIIGNSFGVFAGGTLEVVN
jgi:glycerol uptake facilitator-like aquaporin